MIAPLGAATKQFGKPPAISSATFSHGGTKQSRKEVPISNAKTRRGLHSNIFYLEKKPQTTTKEGNEKIKLLFYNTALLAWKVLEQMPRPPLNIHNVSL